MRPQPLAVALISALAMASSLDGQSIREGAFQSNGVRLRYVEAGSGTPIVLIHGYTRSLDTNWIKSGVLDPLSKDYRVIAYDMPGHGKSDKPHEASAYRDMVSDPVRLMDHLGIKRAHLVGYSMGGGVVARLAVTHPERLITAILGGHSGYREWDDDDEQFNARSIQELESDVPFRSLASVMYPGVAGLTEEQIRAASATIAADTDAKAMAALRRGGLRGLYNTREEAASIRVPLLMIYGSLDSVGAGKSMKNLLPPAQLVVIDGATHGGEKSAARRPEFVAAIRQFIAEHP